MNNITNITPPRVPFLDPRNGLMSREWYRFFLNLFVITGSGTNTTTVVDMQLGPVAMDNSAEIDQAFADAQLAAMTARYETLIGAIDGAYLQPVEIDDGISARVQGLELLPLPSIAGAELSKTDDTNVTLTLGGSPTTALLAAASITAGWAGTLSPARGGTGVANNAAMTVTGSGNFAYTRTLTGATNVTLPTTGTLATLAGSEELTNKTLNASVAKGTWTSSGTWTLPSGTVLVASVLGTPASGTLTNCTGLPIAAGVSGLGTGVATALAVNTGAAGSVLVDQGAWITPAYNAADFSGVGGMTWTVDAGDVGVYRYMIIGKTMWVDFQIATSSVGGTLATQLTIAIPAGKTAAAGFLSWCQKYQGGWAASSCNVTAGGAVIGISADLAGSNWGASANGTYVFGQICFEIQ